MANREDQEPGTDPYYMALAVKRAQEAQLTGDVPVGAILVMDGKIYSREGNEREKGADPTAHAEVLAIRHAADVAQGWRLDEATLYVTVEPCLMCTGAIYLSRIARVVYGCPNPKGGALRFVSEHAKGMGVNHAVSITGGIREMECARLLKDFFAAKRHKDRRDGRAVEGA